MEEFGTDDTKETSQLILLMDRFFDCLNVRSAVEGVRRRKPDLLPYRDVNDPRFQVITCDKPHNNHIIFSPNDRICIDKVVFC